MADQRQPVVSVSKQFLSLCRRGFLIVL